MTVSIKGLDRLIKKLNDISNIETKEILNEVSKEVEESIRNEAKKFTDTSYLYVGKVETRDYGLSCFIDIGLTSDKHPFELWKSLWFQQWGFFNYGLNFSGQIYINNHQLWFDNSIMGVEKQVKKKIKAKLQQEIRNRWEA